MSCEVCEDVREKDGIAPDCETEKGCMLPKLGPGASRILSIRDKLIALQGLVDSGEILKMYDATRQDIELLVEVEKEIQAITPKRDSSMEHGAWGMEQRAKGLNPLPSALSF